MHSGFPECRIARRPHRNGEPTGEFLPESSWSDSHVHPIDRRPDGGHVTDAHSLVAVGAIFVRPTSHEPQQSEDRQRNAHGDRRGYPGDVGVFAQSAGEEVPLPAEDEQ